MNRKELKAEVFRCLRMEDSATMEKALQALPGPRLAGPLMAAFCHGEVGLRWRAIEGLGAVCAGLFSKDPEGVRRIMRRLLWMLNDESGGIGWGCGEAMGEIMARIPLLAREYHRIPCSYMDPGGNYLENPLLQRGVLWGLSRLGQVFPDLVRDMEPLLPFYLEKKDLEILVPALLLAGIFRNGGYRNAIVGHLGDTRRLSFYRGGCFVLFEIGVLAGKVLEGGEVSLLPD